MQASLMQAVQQSVINRGILQTSKNILKQQIMPSSDLAAFREKFLAAKHGK